MMAKLLLRLLPIWEKMDGKKTYTGVTGLILGTLMCFYPPTVSEGIGVVIASVPVIVTGIWHKIIKSKKRKEEAK